MLRHKEDYSVSSLFVDRSFRGHICDPRINTKRSSNYMKGEIPSYFEQGVEGGSYLTVKTSAPVVGHLHVAL